MADGGTTSGIGSARQRARREAFRRALRDVRSALSFPFILLIRLYQVTLSPLMGGQCRFRPTCSEYAIEAYRVHGPVRGTWLAAWRVLRCNPFGGHGYDPVPPPKMNGARSGSDEA